MCAHLEQFICGFQAVWLLWNNGGGWHVRTSEAGRVWSVLLRWCALDRYSCKSLP